MAAKTQTNQPTNKFMWQWRKKPVTSCENSLMRKINKCCALCKVACYIFKHLSLLCRENICSLSCWIRHGRGSVIKNIIRLFFCCWGRIVAGAVKAHFFNAIQSKRNNRCNEFSMQMDINKKTAAIRWNYGRNLCDYQKHFVFFIKIIIIKKKEYLHNNAIAGWWIWRWILSFRIKIYEVVWNKLPFSQR